MTGGAILGLLARHAVPITLAAGLALTALAAAQFRAQRDVARADVALVSRTAEANAAALAHATAEHARHIAALTGETERARAQAARLGANLEAVRRDPSHAAGVAPVLRDAVERLRASRAAGDPAAPAASP